MFRSCLTACFLVIANPLFAQSSLGITGVQLRFGGDDATSVEPFGDAIVDVAITEHHGFQAGLGLIDTPTGVEGRLDAHLYMVPRPGQKFGLLVLLSDFNDLSATYGAIGGEGVFALGERTALELRGGIGAAHPSGLDFVFVEGGVFHDLNDDITVGITTTLTDIDEASLSGVAYAARIGLDYRPAGQPFGAFAEVSHSGISGVSNASGETQVRVGLMLEWGSIRQGGPETRAFRSPDPLRPLINRGLF